MTDIKIITPEDIADYTLEDIKAVQDIFAGMCFWSDDIEYLEKDGVRLTREALDALGDRIDTLSQEQEKRLSGAILEHARTTITIANIDINNGQFDDADRELTTHFNSLAPHHSSSEAAQALTKAHQRLTDIAKEKGVEIKPLPAKKFTR